MFEDFHASDRWTGQRLHSVYQALIVAVATRHADAVDIKFLVSGRPVWIALPHPAWVEYNKRTGGVITDPLAIQVAGSVITRPVRLLYSTQAGCGSAIHTGRVITDPLAIQVAGHFLKTSGS